MTGEKITIGVFDSGMGGLTVLRALRAAMPGQSFLYLGDTARLPYGSRSPDTVVRYALQASEILVQRGIGALVVACNTASAFALEALTARHPELPVFGVVEPGAAAAAAAAGLNAPGGSVLVLATESTVAGGAYQRAILRLRPDLRVHARACSLLVALAEEGEHAGAFCEAVLGRCLNGFLPGGGFPQPATVLLGCTHFPVFRSALERLLPPGTVVVDSAATTAERVAKAFGRDPADRARRAEDARLPDHDPAGASPVTLLATDGVGRFKRVGAYFLGWKPGEVELVDL